MATENHITMKLVPANPDHFGRNGQLYHGRLYFLKSEVTGKFDGKPYYTSEYTDLFAFKDYFRRGMVYVPDDFSGPYEVTEKEE